MEKCANSLSAGLLLLISVFVGSCGGASHDEPEPPKPDTPATEVPTPDEPSQPEGPLPTPGLSFTSITLPNEGDSFSCTIHGLTDGEWSAESDQSWCEVSAVGRLLKISVAPNQSNDRKATVNLLHSDKRKMGSIEVKQCSIVNDKPKKYTALSKNSFYPMFTATWCPFSPDMDRTLVTIENRWDNPILPMRIHVKDSELYTPLSIELSEMYNNSSTPVGYFENYFRVDNLGDANVSIDYFWNLIMNRTCEGTGYPSNCSQLSGEAKITGRTIETSIAITPAEAGNYKLSVFIVGDNIVSSQMTNSGGEITDYTHNGVLLGALTPVKGETLELSTAEKVISLSGNLPDEMNAAALRLLVVVGRDLPKFNYSTEIWYADNCLSIPLAKNWGNGAMENIYIGEDIVN